MDVNLRWIASVPASALHAADAVRHGAGVTDAEVAAAIAEPTEQLCRELRKANVPEEAFWEQALGLSADLVNGRELAAVALRKVLGTDSRATLPVDALGAAIATILAAMRRVRPGLVDEVALAAEPLQAAWEAWGSRLLSRVAELTESELIVAEARVIALPPIRGGAGCAHLAYNTVRIEAIVPDPVPELPEVVRLAWLVAQLHADLPVHSETIPRDRLPILARAAMLAPVLAAAEEAELVRPGPTLLEQAWRAWGLDSVSSAESAAAVTSWWAAYGERRPPWHVALVALDEMLTEPAIAS